jgi:hypothetical protein
LLSGDLLDDTDGNSLSHITDSETSKWWVFGEGFNAQWLGWDELDDGSITGLDVLWFLF